MWLPVVVLTREPLGRHLYAVIVGSVTSTVRELSTKVEVGPEDGVRIPSVVNLDNLQLMDRRRLVRRVGRVRPAALRQIYDAAAITIGFA